MSNFLPTQLSILKEYVPSAEETAALVSHAKTEVHSIVHQPRFNGVRENSLQMSSIIIDAIANK